MSQPRIEQPDREQSPAVADGGPAGRSVWIGRALVVGAALLWSMSGVFAKAPLFDDWPADRRGLLLAFWRAVFGAVVLLPLVRRPRWRWGFVPLCLAFPAMSGMLLSAMVLTTAANATWLQATAPFWIGVLNWVFLRRAPHRRDLTPLAFAVAGIGTILAFELQGQAMTGVLLGVGSGAFYATVIIMLAHLGGEESVWVVAVAQAATALVLLPGVIAFGIWPNWWQLLVLVGFGVFQMGIPYMLVHRGLRRVSSQEATLIGLVEPAVLPLWVFLAWDEVPAWWTAVGAGLILSGLVVRYLLLERRRLPT